VPDESEPGHQGSHDDEQAHDRPQPPSRLRRGDDSTPLTAVLCHGIEQLLLSGILDCFPPRLQLLLLGHELACAAEPLRGHTATCPP
jgi:hypothetical protein